MDMTSLAPPRELIHLSGISWQTYDRLLQELSDRRLRLTYYHGRLQIMAPSPEHERYKRVIGRFVETLAEELTLNIEPLGSITLKHPDVSGAEPDECFYIQNLSAIEGKTWIDLAIDPPPDLVIEIDITSSSINRLLIYAQLGVSEIWRYDGESFEIYVLSDRQYQLAQESLAFPGIEITQISQFLAQVGNQAYLDIIQDFRRWIQRQLG
ncbi:MAG: Uma2 family endonuclease [Roseofilum sp. SBFL]|nr:Uma2 family endonuclease [Roseofilum sp. SID3]MBP0026612.1 Uma2 family endonuclease [Roseofilum sp. SID2]MBP0036944.1 Uma2 family endonuclease [Roseofilum sp. SID1]MBP0042091.1 Uma2 family endonuclease [Roseofilum sp. SBFL]